MTISSFFIRGLAATKGDKPSGPYLTADATGLTVNFISQVDRMAARKSCTHLTWAEAKNKSGIGGVKKNKEFLRKQNHGQLQAQKIIAKQGGVNDEETRKLKKEYRKLDEKSAALATQREEEREQKRLASLQEVRPYDRAKDKCQACLRRWRVSENETGGDALKFDQAQPTQSINVDDEGIHHRLAECKRMQLDEITALEALIDPDDFCVFDATTVSNLRHKLELKVELLPWILDQPPLSFVIFIEVDDYRERSADDEDMMLNALVLLRVTLPPLYLDSANDVGQLPLWDFDHVMVTNKNMFCSTDKPLESLAWLDTKSILQAMSQFAQDELMPYPCVYEVAVTWLSEHIFDYFHMHPHLSITSK
jgi:hypothetical protein